MRAWMYNGTIDSLTWHLQQAPSESVVNDYSMMWSVGDRPAPGTCVPACGWRRSCGLPAPCVPPPGSVPQSCHTHTHTAHRCHIKTQEAILYMKQHQHTLHTNDIIIWSWPPRKQGLRSASLVGCQLERYVYKKRKQEKSRTISKKNFK